MLFSSNAMLLGIQVNIVFPSCICIRFRQWHGHLGVPVLLNRLRDVDLLPLVVTLQVPRQYYRTQLCLFLPFIFFVNPFHRWNTLVIVVASRNSRLERSDHLTIHIAVFHRASCLINEVDFVVGGVFPKHLA